MIVKKNGHASVRFASCLCCCVQHVFNEDSISGGRIVNKDMCNMRIPTPFVSVFPQILHNDLRRMNEKRVHQ